MPRPRSPRLAGYDYSTPGPYFITICTAGRRLIFEDQCLREAVVRTWENLPSHYPITLDAFVVMPNHIHGLLFLNELDDPIESAAGQRPAATGARCRNGIVSLSQVVASLKSYSSKEINRRRHMPGGPVWQPSFWDRIIRSNRALDPIRSYIIQNPINWERDPLNPALRNQSADDLWNRLELDNWLGLPGE